MFPGDEEAEDASREAASMAASAYLESLGGSAPGRRLRALRFDGPCSQSLKFQPVPPGAAGAEAMSWLWGMVGHHTGLGFLW